MPEKPKSRPLRMEDIFDQVKPIRNNYSNVHDNNIEKNQKEFGNRKRIKP